MITNNCGIYKITNTLTGDFYIGSSNKIKERIQHHIRALDSGYHRNPYLQRAWLKYGEQAFVFSLVLTCDIEHKLFLEQKLLDLFKPAYNIAMNASAPTTGLHRSKETRAKISEANRRRIRITKPKITKPKPATTPRKSRKGTHLSDEIRAKMSEGQKHRAPASDETNLKISVAHKGELNAFFGKRHTEETKRKISEKLICHFAQIKLNSLPLRNEEEESDG